MVFCANSAIASTYALGNEISCFFLFNPLLPYLEVDSKLFRLRWFVVNVMEIATCIIGTSNCRYICRGVGIMCLFLQEFLMLLILLIYTL